LLLVSATVLLSGLIASAYADDKLPSGEELIEKYIAATGGRAAYEKVKSRTVQATLAVPAQKMSGQVIVYQKSPGLYLETATVAGAGTEQRGYDTKTGVGWSTSDMSGVRLVKGDELDHLRREADLQGDLDWKKQYSDAKTVGVEPVNGSDCYKVELTTKSGKTETRYYDKSSGLLQRTVSEVTLPNGKIGIDASITDYRDVEGMKVAFKNTATLNVSGTQLEQVVTLDKIEMNPNIPDAKFAAPESVKKLIEKEKASPTTAK